MKEAEYLKLKRKLDEKYNADLSALETVWRMANNTPPPNGRSSGGTANTASRGQLANAIKESIPSLEGDFTVSDIEALLSKNHPGLKSKRPSISQVLKRLAEDEEMLVLVKRGEGRAFSVYRKK